MYSFLPDKPTAYLQSFSFMTINGSELSWRDHSDLYRTNKMGSNCYSFALNDFQKDNVRDNKSVPGDITEWFLKQNLGANQVSLTKSQSKLRSDVESTRALSDHNWRTCTKAVTRLLLDGRTAALMHEMMGNPIKSNSTIKRIDAPNLKVKYPIRKTASPIEKALNIKVPSSYRKVLMVVDAISPGDSVTDFHFYAQYAIPVGEVYNQTFEVMLKGGATPQQSIYSLANINAFTSNKDIRDKYGHVIMPFTHQQLLPLRALTNLQTHLYVIPKYCIFFICDPFWIFDVDPMSNNPSKKMRTVYSFLKKWCKKHNEELGLLVIKKALVQANSVLRGETRLLSKKSFIGLWGHKAGWATGAMNADGDGKLIFDPALCNRDHGGYDYDTPCVVVAVLKGMGITSVPSILKR
jgi:hypothetical protein